jgi:hypothetical protein
MELITDHPVFALAFAAVLLGLIVWLHGEADVWNCS